MSKRSKARWKRPGGKFRQAYTAIGGECPSCLGVFPIERTGTTFNSCAIGATSGKGECYAP